MIRSAGLWLTITAGLAVTGTNAYATNAIAVWAVSDKLPVSGMVPIGVSAYHESGLSVTFSIDGTPVGTATREELNPVTGYPEYFVTVNTADYGDGDHNLDATATPTSGEARSLDRLTLRVQNAFTGRKYYVKFPGGNNNQDGLSPDNAWLTIGHAMSACGDGDSVIVMEGTYYVAKNIFRDGAAAYRFWVAENRNVTLNFGDDHYFGSFECLDGFTFAGDIRTYWKGNAPGDAGDHVVLKNCIYQHSSYSLYCLHASGLTDCAFHNVTVANTSEGTFGNVLAISGVQRCIFRGWDVRARGCDFFSGGASDLLMENVSVHDHRMTYNDSDWHADFFQFSGNDNANLIFRAIKSWYTGSVQMHMDGSAKAQTDDIAYINCMNAAAKGPYCMHITGTHACLVHCTIQPAGEFDASLAGVSVIRNCLVKNGPLGATVDQYNCYTVQGSGSSAAGNFVDAGPHCVKNAVSDAEYQAGVVADFSLKAGSACIDAGSDGDPVRFDANNNVRDEQPDIGAIEYGMTAVALNRFAGGEPPSAPWVTVFPQPAGAPGAVTFTITKPVPARALTVTALTGRYHARLPLHANQAQWRPGRVPPGVYLVAAGSNRRKITLLK